MAAWHTHSNIGIHMKDTYICFFHWGFFFRVWGYGLHIKRAKGHIPLFSERNGYKKAHYFFGLRFMCLRP